MSHSSFADLVDYWAGDLPAGDEALVEEHAFECDACSRRMNSVGQLADGVLRTVGRRGGFAVTATQAMVEQLERDGLVTHHYRAKLGDVVACHVRAEDDLLVTTIEADLSSVERLRYTLLGDSRQMLFQMDDVPVDRATGLLVFADPAELMRSTYFEDAIRGGPRPPGVVGEVLGIVLRLSSLEDGGERLLGEVVLRHRAFSS